MTTMMSRLFAFRAFNGDETFCTVSYLIDRVTDPLPDIAGLCFDEDVREYFDAVHSMAEYAEQLGAEGNPWLLWLAKLFAETETPFSLANERRKTEDGSIKRKAKPRNVGKRICNPVNQVRNRTESFVAVKGAERKQPTHRHRQRYPP